MTESISRRAVTRGLAWTAPAVAATAAAPWAAASGPAGPGPGPGPGPIPSPDPTPVGLCDCAVHWTAGAIIDLSTPDYSNSNYTAIKHDDCGYLKTHHFTDAAKTKLYWRVPLGTAQPIEAGAQLVLESVSGNWDFIPGSLQDQTDTGAFARFTTITDQYGNVPAGRLTYTLDGSRLVVTLPAMPADSHIIFTVAAKDSSGVPLTGNRYEVKATLTGTYTPEALKTLNCA